MQKILLVIVTTFLMYSGIGAVFAETNAQKVIVSEKVPGANCVPYGWGYRADGAEQDLAAKDVESLRNSPWTKSNPDGSLTLSDWTKIKAPSQSITSRKYICTIEPGLAGFQQMLATIIRWFVNIVMLAGVLAIVWLGIAWSLAWGDDAKAKSELKKWWMNIFVGMIILFFFRYLLQFLAPWIYR